MAVRENASAKFGVSYTRGFMVRSLGGALAPSASGRHMIFVLSRIATSDLQALSNLGGDVRVSVSRATLEKRPKLPINSGRQIWAGCRHPPEALIETRVKPNDVRASRLAKPLPAGPTRQGGFSHNCRKSDHSEAVSRHKRGEVDAIVFPRLHRCYPACKRAPVHLKSSSPGTTGLARRQAACLAAHGASADGRRVLVT
jgi:hypothetical protein